jgi:ureidoglycolate lyase
LTPEAFAPFGKVITAGGASLTINNGATERFHRLATIDSGEGGQVIVSVFRSRPIQLPFQIRVMERHPLGSQTFVPLDNRPYLVVVAPPGDFDPSLLRAFRASGRQGVHFRRGVWHHYNLALEETSTFLVIDREGPGRNLDVVELSQPTQIASDTQHL